MAKNYLREQPVLLGKQHSLVGIFARPVEQGLSDKPIVVILNTGIVHRVGHHRMFVTMSRELVRAGFSVLRFDLSGLGDSPTRNDASLPVESAVADIREAIDWLEAEYKSSGIILVGLCSGADYAVLYSSTDARVSALALMDPTIPATTRFYFQYLAQRITRLRSWCSVAVGRSYIFRIWKRQLWYRIAMKSKLPLIAINDISSRVFFEQSYKAIIDRGVKILAVFTEDTTRQTYREQMIDAFPTIPFGDQLHLEFFAGSDHIFSLEKDRVKLMEVILGWAKSLSVAPFQRESLI
jgi:pimeloyl-ACP methyl ester carboxylesterase